MMGLIFEFTPTGPDHCPECKSNLDICDECYDIEAASIAIATGAWEE